MTTQLSRSLGFFATTSLVVGTMIGTGVFLKASVMSQTVGSTTWVIAAWVIAGAISLLGAMTYAELGSAHPHAGGEYVYLREGYGETVAFLYGWQRFLIGSPATIAAYAVGATTFLSGSFEIWNAHPILFSCGLIVLFTGINCLTVELGGQVQTFLTALKILLVVGVGICGFYLYFVESHSPALSQSSPSHAFPPISHFGAALISALWAYDGWNNMPMAAGEVKNPERVIPQALVGGVGLVMLAYVFVNMSYFLGLPFHEIISSYSSENLAAPSVATKVITSTWGTSAAVFMGVGMFISAVGAMNGSILTSARVPYAMAHDKNFFDVFRVLGKSSGVPIYSILIQGLISIVFALSGSFDFLTDLVVFSAFIFYALCAGIVFKNRRSKKALIFIVISIALLANSVMTMPLQSLIGTGLILLGLPLYWFYFYKRI